MLNDPVRLANLILVATVFMAVFTFWLAGLSLWSIRRAERDRRVQERLGLAPEGADRLRTLRLWHEGREATTSVAAPAGVPSLLAHVERTCLAAGWQVAPASFLLTVGAVLFAFFIVAIALTGRVASGVGVAVAALFLFNAYIQHRINRRAALFERQFLDALHVAVTSLRAGHPITGAFRFVSMEIAPPVGEVFAEMCQRQELGVALERVVSDAAARSGSPDMKVFATSVVVQVRSGGNLADMMERLASVVRDRVGINRRLRVLTAQTQFSKRVLIALPFVLFALLNLVNPQYMEPLYTTPMGKLLLCGSGMMLIIGVWAMNRLSVIEF